MYIEAIKKENSLVLVLKDKKFMDEVSKDYPDDFGSDNVLYEFFEGFIANTEFEWIAPEEIGALTDAPILGVRDESETVIEAYGYMDYAVRSLLEDLRDYGEAVLQKG